jgi:hypothetical protein
MDLSSLFAISRYDIFLSGFALNRLYLVPKYLLIASSISSVAAPTPSTIFSAVASPTYKLCWYAAYNKAMSFVNTSPATYRLSHTRYTT